MTDETEEVEITVDDTVRDELQTFLKTTTQKEPDVLKRSNLGGDAATWIILAQLGVQALPSLVTFLQGLTGRGGVRKYKIGDVEVENPSAKDVELLRELVAKRAGG